MAEPAGPVILVMGDSISAGFGLPAQAGWVNILQHRLQQKVPSTRLINASISGETTQGGLTRLAALLQQHQPSVTIIELGGNDGLRGVPIKVIDHNLRQMIMQAQLAHSQVLLLGMQIPPNYGVRYTELFARTYPQLAQERQVALVPFLLEGIAGQDGMMQNDGIHPATNAQPRLADLVEQQLQPLLDGVVQ